MSPYPDTSRGAPPPTLYPSSRCHIPGDCRIIAAEDMVARTRNLCRWRPARARPLFYKPVQSMLGLVTYKEAIEGSGG